MIAIFPAHAGTVLDNLLGGKAGPKHKYACFTRIYDDGHLKSHPKQNVRTMKMLVTAATPGESPNDYQLEHRFHVSFAQRDLAHRREVATPATEKAGRGPAEIDCSLSCGGDSIGVTLKSSTAVLVAIPASAQQWDPTHPDADLVKSAFGPDDKLFRLERSPISTCADLGQDESERRLLKSK